MNFCQKIELKDCLVPISATECFKCNLGYLSTDDRKCKLQPLPKISNCIEYETFNTCKRCGNSFFLSNP